MPTFPLLEDADLSPEAKAVFDEIRAVRKTDYVNNFWRAIAHDPALLRRTWESLREVMGNPHLDAKTKELIYVAVSAANGCDYCIHSHTAAARQKGAGEEEILAVYSIVGMASETNRLAQIFGVPVDDIFAADDRVRKDHTN